MSEHLKRFEEEIRQDERAKFFQRLDRLHSIAEKLSAEIVGLKGIANPVEDIAARASKSTPRAKAKGPSKLSNDDTQLLETQILTTLGGINWKEPPTCPQLAENLPDEWNTAHVSKTLMRLEKQGKALSTGKFKAKRYMLVQSQEASMNGEQPTADEG
jgi:hypothetical protein